MTDTTFVKNNTKIPATWLNDVNTNTYGPANKAAAVLIQPALGLKIFIGGSDGGPFKAVVGAAPGTYADSDPTYCGVTIIPAGGDGSTAWVRVDGGYTLNTAWFGSDYTGSTDSSDAFINAYAAAEIGQGIIVPPGAYLRATATTGTKEVTWYTDGATTDTGGLLSLPATQIGKYLGRTRISRSPTAVNDYSALNVARDVTISGGTPGSVGSAIRVGTVVAAGVDNYEWGILSIMDNYSAAGNNVAIYGQAKKRADGPTWAGVFEARDERNLPSSGSSAGLVGIELDMWANEADTNNNRVGLDIIVGKAEPAGVLPEIYAGIRLIPQNNSVANGKFLNGLILEGNVTQGININSDGTKGIVLTGTNALGIDLSGGTHSTAAIRIKSGEVIALEGTSTVKFKYNSGSSSIEFLFGATVKGQITVGTTATLKLNGTQVVTARQTGWSATTGTELRTNFGDASLAATSQALRALIVDLKTHGLIGA